MNRKSSSDVAASYPITPWSGRGEDDSSGGGGGALRTSHHGTWCTLFTILTNASDSHATWSRLLPSAPHGTVRPAWYRLPCMVPSAPPGSAGPVFIGPRLHAAALFRGCAAEMLCLPMQAANLRCGVMVARHK